LSKLWFVVTVNAADNKQRDPKGMTTIKIDIDPYVYQHLLFYF